MASFCKHVTFVLMVLALVHNNEATAPIFLQAITSALGVIPFTTGPMTTGLVGAKLAVGSKLLYYLGFFGRRQSKSKPVPVSTPQVKPNFGLASGGQFPGGMQAVPLPYTFGGGAFPQQFMGYGQPNFYGGYPYGYDPAQLFQMLVAQGIDPLPAMQAINFNGGAGSQAIPSSQFPFTSGAGTGSGFPATSGTVGMNSNFDQKPPANVHSQSEGDGEPDSDVDSFFSFLRDMDDNTCISRLICDIGANPSFLGDFSENIYGIISQLEVQPSSGAFQYITIMETGKREGSCNQKFPQCSDAAYEVVKNVAPSVGMPQNINSETVKQL